MSSSTAYRFCLVVLSGAMTALAACQSTIPVTKPERNGTYTIAAGETVVLETSYLTLDIKCQAKPLPQITIVGKPAHGTAATLVRKAAAQYGPGPYRHCHGVITDSTAVSYAPASGFRGADQFMTRVVFSDGETIFKAIKVVVK